MLETTDTQKFHDINKFPKEEGVLIFGVSMSQIDNIQSAQKTFEYMEYLIPKILKPAVGLNVIYSDSLYFNSDEKASVLKRRYQHLSYRHKFGFIKLLEKHPQYVPSAVSFMSFSQIILESKEYLPYMDELKRIYEKDETFQKYIARDINTKKKKPTDNEVQFVLEEILLFYLASKGRVRLPNDYVQDKQKWVLWCYPGDPLLSEIYLYQQNFFNLHNEENVYENSYYDLEGKILYDYTKIDLENFK